ncbi:MAG: ATP-binding protein [Chryseolinea sp.]
MAGPSEYQVALLIAIGTVGMLLLAIAIILFMVFYQKKMIQEQYNRQVLEIKYQQMMMEAALESQESERKRVAGDLHDSVGGMLSAIRVGLTSLARQLPDPLLFEQQKRMLDDAIGSVRAISRDLMPSTLEKFGLMQAVKELCEQYRDTALINISFIEHNEVSALIPSKQLMTFRIAQELVNNAVKHSHAAEIIVAVKESNNLEIVIEDDGIGFDADAVRYVKGQGNGVGLFNMESRVRLLNAALVQDKLRGKGTKFTLTVPL